MEGLKILNLDMSDTAVLIQQIWSYLIFLNEYSHINNGVQLLGATDRMVMPPPPKRTCVET